MITTITTFKLPEAMTLDLARTICESSVPNYHGVPSLLRKLFLLAEGNKTAGGKYLTEPNLTEPSVVYYETPVIVDSLSDVVQNN